MTLKTQPITRMTTEDSASPEAGAARSRGGRRGAVADQGDDGRSGPDVEVSRVFPHKTGQIVSFAGIAIVALFLGFGHSLFDRVPGNVLWQITGVLMAFVTLESILRPVLIIRGGRLVVHRSPILPSVKLNAAEVAGIERNGKRLHLIRDDGSKVRVALSFIAPLQRETAVQLLSKATGVPVRDV